MKHSKRSPVNSSASPSLAVSSSGWSGTRSSKERERPVKAARQWLYFQEVGFHLHDTIPMDRSAAVAGAEPVRESLEYAFVVSKGRPTLWT